MLRHELVAARIGAIGRGSDWSTAGLSDVSWFSRLPFVLPGSALLAAFAGVALTLPAVGRHELEGWVVACAAVGDCAQAGAQSRTSKDAVVRTVWQRWKMCMDLLSVLTRARGASCCT